MSETYNILVACDHSYYIDWAEHLLRSINHHNPWIRLHCHVVNPLQIDRLDYVDYTTENREFESEDSKIGYLQAVRFLVVADKFKSNELVMTLDADTICTTTISKEEISVLFEATSVLVHTKKHRWLAGLVTFNENNFRYDLADMLRDKKVNTYQPGIDQKLLSLLANKYSYTPIGEGWMSFGKNKSSSVFLTLKGAQKSKDKFCAAMIRYRVRV